MFHIKFPAQKDFLSWVELGCLARALGFPTGVIRDHVNHEIHVTEEGIPVQQLQRMVDLKLLHAALHRSCNHHTADWNLCVLQRSLQFLQLNIFSFEELHNIRLAYATYEASDMKGLHTDQRTLLRTLKMCQRVISPQKLKHRVKHMKRHLEESNRLQLYEFFDLVLWCDLPDTVKQVDSVVQVEGKDNDLYKMVDFRTLLSHRDLRRSRVLDERYLAEERDFGRERLGAKHMFKDEVIRIERRVQQTHVQKRKYRGLKQAVNQSQRQVYRAHAGSIRPRPISAPDLSMYAAPRVKPRDRSRSAAAVYESMQRKLRSAHSNVSSPSRAVSHDVRPASRDPPHAHTPSVVTSDDLDDLQLRVDNLQFDISTLESRCQVKLEEEKGFYIPHYQPRPPEPPAEPRRPQPQPRPQHWTPEIIRNLVQPAHRLPPSHAQVCDARFRGWKDTERPGRHRILTVPTFDNSPNGRLLTKQRAFTMAPVCHLHGDFVTRRTRYSAGKQHKQQQTVPARPLSAPAGPRMSNSSKTSRRRTEAWCQQQDSVYDEEKDLDSDVESCTRDKATPDPAAVQPPSDQSEFLVRSEKLPAEESARITEDNIDPALESPSEVQVLADLISPVHSSAAVTVRKTGRKKTKGLLGAVRLLESIQEDLTEDEQNQNGISPSTQGQNCDQTITKGVLKAEQKELSSQINMKGKHTTVNGATSDFQQKKFRKDDLYSVHEEETDYYSPNKSRSSSPFRQHVPNSGQRLKVSQNDSQSKKLRTEMIEMDKNRTKQALKESSVDPHFVVDHSCRVGGQTITATAAAHIKDLATRSDHRLDLVGTTTVRTVGSSTGEKPNISSEKELTTDCNAQNGYVLMEDHRCSLKSVNDEKSTTCIDQSGRKKWVFDDSAVPELRNHERTSDKLARLGIDQLSIEPQQFVDSTSTKEEPKFKFTKINAHRLLYRVDGMVSPELKARVISSNIGLHAQTV